MESAIYSREWIFLDTPRTKNNNIEVTAIPSVTLSDPYQMMVFAPLMIYRWLLCVCACDCTCRCVRVCVPACVCVCVLCVVLEIF